MFNDDDDDDDDDVFNDDDNDDDVFNDDDVGWFCDEPDLRCDALDVHQQLCCSTLQPQLVPRLGQALDSSTMPLSNL